METLLVSDSTIISNLRRTARKNLISSLSSDELNSLALKYFGISKNGELVGYMCPYSGQILTDTKDIVLEHIIPISSGGGTTLYNCIPTSTEVNKVSEKGIKNLISWWVNSKFWDEKAPERLEKILQYILEAYSYSFNSERGNDFVEVLIDAGIDVRVIYDKLEIFDPEFVEKLLLHLQTYNRNALSKDDRVNELLTSVYNLGYIPFLQESRFSDGTDMFSWYNVYKERIPNLEMEVNAKIKTVPPTRKVNIYLIPNFRNTGGKFYTICTNEGERLDLSVVSSFEEAKKLDENLVKRGGVILKGDEEIESVNFAKGKAK